MHLYYSQAACQAQHEQALDKQQAALNTRESGLDARKAALDAREKGLDTRTKELNAKEAAVADRARRLDEQEAALKLSQKKLQADVDKHAAEKEAWEAEKQRMLAAIQAEQRELAQRKEQLDAQVGCCSGCCAASGLEHWHLIMCCNFQIG